MRLRTRSRTLLTVSATALVVLGTTGVALTQDAGVPAPVRPALEGNRGPFEVAFTPDGSRALVTEFDEGALAIIDAASGKVLNHVSTEGKQPTGVAVTPDGKLALVTNSFSGSLAFVDLAALKTTTLPIPGAPYDVVVSPDGSTAYVSISQLDQVAVVNLATRKIEARMPSGRRPRALSLTPDGRVLVSANLTQGSVTFFNTATRQPFAQGPTPAVNLRGVAVYPNGRLVYAVGQRAQNERPTESAVGIWSNQAFHQVPNGQRNGAENIWLDLIGTDVSDPESVVLDANSTTAYVTCSGGHSVNVLPVRGNRDPQVVKAVGAVPKGLAFRPGTRELWVANHLGNDLAVVDTGSLAVTRRVNLGPTSRKDPHLRGRFLFHTATLAKGGQFSCNSCHPDGNTDGISWKFVHVPDGLGKEINRNVRGLRGHLEDTAPFRWTGYDKTLEDFVQEEVEGLFQSPRLNDSDLRALVEFVKSLPLPPNPYRNPDGSHTQQGLRGKQLFMGKADCISCHTGPKAGGQRKAWIGLTPEGVDLDVPHLVGVYDTYPYLHDGRADTLEEIFEKHNGRQLHGKAHVLTPDEFKDLIRYVKEL